jgi:hypothetical protein
VVASAPPEVSHTVTVVGPCANTNSFCTGDRTVTYNSTDSGSSNFRYSGTTWTFNLQTKDSNGTPYATGFYYVTISPSPNPPFRPLPSPFWIQLTK